MDETLRHLWENQRVILKALHHVITRLEQMAKIHDDIASVLQSNGSLSSDIDGKIAKLAAMKGESDTAFSDILTTVKAQNEELVKTNAALDAALGEEIQPVEAPAPAALSAVDEETASVEH